MAEYWLQTNDPSVISVVQLDNVGLLTALRMAWDDLFEIQAFPAVTADAGWRCSGRWRPRSGRRSDAPVHVAVQLHPRGLSGARQEPGGPVRGSGPAS